MCVCIWNSYSYKTAAIHHLTEQYVNMNMCKNSPIFLMKKTRLGYEQRERERASGNKNVFTILKQNQPKQICPSDHRLENGLTEKCAKRFYVATSCTKRQQQQQPQQQ